jgi:hypothetical protein
MSGFVGINYFIWKTVTEDLITDRHYDGGDLTRMGYLPGSKMYRHNTTELPRRHLELKDYDGRHIDMLTIGDSFSSGGGGGYNRFYQDYIASYYNFEVLNVNPPKDLDFISTISILLNNGFLEQAQTRYVLLGATEIGWKEWSHQINFEQSTSMTDLAKFPVRNNFGKLPQVPFINNGNFKFLLFDSLYRASDNAVFSKVYKTKLTRQFFSVPDGDKLLYIPYRHIPSATDVDRVNQNLNELSDRLNSRGIRLIFMPFTDKYTLYARWMEKKRFPESLFFEYLRPLPKRYLFIDTKVLLQEALERDEKDVYYADDTHSSWKASEKIFSTVHLNGRR